MSYFGTGAIIDAFALVALGAIALILGGAAAIEFVRDSGAGNGISTRLRKIRAVLGSSTFAQERKIIRHRSV